MVLNKGVIPRPRKDIWSWLEMVFGWHSLGKGASSRERLRMLTNTCDAHRSLAVDGMFVPHPLIRVFKSEPPR